MTIHAHQGVSQFSRGISMASTCKVHIALLCVLEVHSQALIKALLMTDREDLHKVLSIIGAYDNLLNYYMDR